MLLTSRIQIDNSSGVTTKYGLERRCWCTTINLCRYGLASFLTFCPCLFYATHYYWTFGVTFELWQYALRFNPLN